MYLFLAVLGLRCCTSFLYWWRVGATFQLQCKGFSPQGLLLSWSTGSRLTGFRSCKRAGSAVAVLRFSCSTACRIFPVQGSNSSLLHWQADSLLVSHQGSPHTDFFTHSQGSPPGLLALPLFLHFLTSGILYLVFHLIDSLFSW